MTPLAFTYDHQTRGFECQLEDRTVIAPVPDSWPLDQVSVSIVGSQYGDMLRLAYSSHGPDGRRVIVIVHVDACTGELIDAPAVSDTIDDDFAAALLEAAAETVNPPGALRDLLDFRAEYAA